MKTPQSFICPQTRMMEFLSAGYALWWTILLLLPVNLFSSNLAFLGLQRISGEPSWAWATGTVCAVQSYGWLSGLPLVRWAGCFAGGLLWAFVGAGVIFSAPLWYIVPINTGAGVYGLSAGINLYCAAVVLPRFCLPGLCAVYLRFRLKQIVNRS